MARVAACMAHRLHTKRSMNARTDLELVALTKRYGDALAVAGIDLRIAAGAYCCLLGPSGCGKTSTLRMIAGHEAPSEGSVVLGGREITALEPAERGTAMMFQSYALFPHLTVLENVAFSARMKGRARGEREARAMELLELVALAPLAQRLPAALSGIKAVAGVGGEPGGERGDKIAGDKRKKIGRLRARIGPSPPAARSRQGSP